MKKELEVIKNMGNRKKQKKDERNGVEIWTEEQYEEYMKELYDMEFIAGFTEGGVPYGIFNGEGEGTDEFDSTDTLRDSDEELPF